jgi:alpha-galactosidase
MKIKLLVLLLLLGRTYFLFAQYSDLAKTPPMGWNSWNAFGLNINSTIVKSVADSMHAKGMAAAGYEYIVIDDGWQIDRDATGKIIVDSMRFPEGIKYLADYIHSKGLKFGIYTCCGTKTCGGRPGSYGYEMIDAKTYAEWGVDFIKEDWCFTTGLDTRIQYKAMSDAIRATGRPMILSLCEWGTSSPWEWAKGIGAMWRTTNDIQDCFDCVRNWGGMGWVPILEANVNLAPFAGHGHWNDPDMLEVGNKALSLVECRSHFSMWCMIAAPLIAGNNISTMNNNIRDILTAPEIIAIDQDPLGIQGIRIRNEAGLQIWQKPLSDGSIAVALFNSTINAASMSVSLEEIGFKKGIKSSVRDLWERKDLPTITNAFKADVEPHGVVVIKIKGKRNSISLLRFDQPEIVLNLGNHKLIQLQVVPSMIPLSVTSSNENCVSSTISGVNMFKLSAKKVGDCTINAVTTDGKTKSTCKVKVLASNLPEGWKLDDINDDKASVSYQNGYFTIEAGGSDIWAGNDQFAFVNRKVQTDSYISARIISQSETHPWAKSGLMIRQSESSKSAFIMLCTTPNNGLSLQWRDTTGGNCSKVDYKAVAMPFFIKLSKSGTSYKAYTSNNGIQWNLLVEKTLIGTVKGDHLVGLEVVSHTSQILNITEFDQVKVGTTEK